MARALRAELPSHITLFKHLPFEGRDALFDFMFEGLKHAPRKAKIRMNTGYG